MEKKEKALEKLKERKSNYKACFHTQAGQEVLKDLERVCYYNFTTFSKDPQELAYREGIRAVYLHIKSMLKDEKEA